MANAVKSMYAPCVTHRMSVTTASTAADDSQMNMSLCAGIGCPSPYARSARWARNRPRVNKATPSVAMAKVDVMKFPAPA